MIAGRLSKSSASTMLSGNLIKHQLRLSLAPDEQEAEELLIGRGAH